MKVINTINDAIKKVLKTEGHALPAKEIFSRIVELDLYEFKAVDPYHVVLTQLRRHCVGLDFPTAHKEKLYRILADGTYDIAKEGAHPPPPKLDGLQINLNILRENHRSYLIEFKKKILDQLKVINPKEFEEFSRKLLEVYVKASLSL